MTGTRGPSETQVSEWVERYVHAWRTAEPAETSLVGRAAIEPSHQSR
jgi:hypothetical protein